MRYVFVLAIKEDWDEPIIESFVAPDEDMAYMMFYEETDFTSEEIEEGVEKGEICLIVKCY